MGIIKFDHSRLRSVKLLWDINLGYSPYSNHVSIKTNTIFLM